MPIDEMTQQILSAELTATQHQLEGAENAIKGWIAQRTALQLKIAALKGIDGFTPPPVPTQGVVPAPPGSGAVQVTASITATGQPPAVKTIENVDQSTGEAEPKRGFRDAIRDVLRNSSRGMRARDVLNGLRLVGFEPGGTSDPSIRVATELHRMTKSNQIKKRGNLYYAIDSV